MRLGTKGLVTAILAAATAQVGFADITLNLESVTAAPGSTFTFDAVFTVDPPETVITWGYQVALTVSGPDDKLTLTGASAATMFNGQDGSFVFVPDNGTMPVQDIYAFADFLLTGDAFIQDGVTFATFTAQLAADATGPYQIDWYLIEDGAYKSMFIAPDVSEIPITYNGATVMVPEPTSMGLLGVAAGLLMARRRK